jgi:hypothetical protein
MLGLEIVIAAALACGGDGGVQTIQLRSSGDGACHCDGGGQCGGGGQKIVVGKKSGQKVTLSPGDGDGDGATEVVVTSRGDGSAPEVRTFTLPHGGGAHAYVLRDGKLEALPEGVMKRSGAFKTELPKNVRVRSVDGNEVVLPKNARVLKLDGNRRGNGMVVPDNVRVIELDGNGRIVAPKNVRVKSLDGGGHGSGGGVRKLRELPGGTMLRIEGDGQVVPLVKRSSSRTILL